VIRITTKVYNLLFVLSHTPPVQKNIHRRTFVDNFLNYTC